MAIKRESGALRFEGTRDLEDSRSQRPRESHFELIHSLDCNLASPNFRTAAQISLSITSDILHLDAAHESSLRGREREAHGEKVQVLKKQPAGGSSGTLGFILLFLLFHFPLY